MQTLKSRSLVLVYQCVGALLIIAFCWLREMTGLPQLLAGARPHQGDWRDAALGTVLILVVWAVGFLMTYRLVRHLVYLEGLIHVCAWCRKVCYRGSWLPLEEYFQRGFHVKTTHGICPACLQKATEDTTRFFKRKGSEARSTPEGSAPSAPGPTG